MSKFAKGKNAYAISDRSGMRYRYGDMKKEWNGAFVGRDEFEPKHPQLGPFKSGADPQALKDARPSRVENAVEVILRLNPFTSSSAGSGVISVHEVGHGRSSSDTVRFRTVAGFDGFTKAVIEQSVGYSITVVDLDTYTFTANVQTATIGGVVGGGGRATAGPTTVIA
tara:strand:- start:778 stop:1281 length:504 start_codon:yes stop_codon:yes gene_type:complete